MPWGMQVTSDSSARTATVQYVYSMEFVNTELPIGTGLISVVEATHTTSSPDGWITETAKRPGPPPPVTDTCWYDAEGYVMGTAEVVHLVPQTRPSLEEIQAWCSQQWWFRWFPDGCPTWVADGTGP